MKKREEIVQEINDLLDDIEERIIYIGDITNDDIKSDMIPKDFNKETVKKLSFLFTSADGAVDLGLKSVSDFRKSVNAFADCIEGVYTRCKE